MTQTIPQNLIERCQDGEHQAQMEIYSILFRGVYSSALRITRNKADAEDITQEAFLKIFRDINRYRDHLPATIRRIAINASIDLLRRKKINFTELEPQHELQEQPQSQIHETEQEIQTNAQAIREAIELLPTGYRLVITLRLIEDLSFEEIAQELKISSGTARSQFVRAKQRLIERLKTNSTQQRP